MMITPPEDTCRWTHGGGAQFDLPVEDVFAVSSLLLRELAALFADPFGQIGVPGELGVSRQSDPSIFKDATGCQRGGVGKFSKVTNFRRRGRDWFRFWWEGNSFRKLLITIDESNREVGNGN